MGNKQSQSSDEEEREPTYTYHEDILRNAQQLTEDSVQAGTESLVYESDNEEFYSADEGESDRSITPQRTRPESSSGEDFSDDSRGEAEEDEHEDENDLSSQAQTTVPKSNLSTSLMLPGGRVLRSSQTRVQCNISRYEEHDSISPELETSRWHLNDSSVLSNRSNTESQRFTASKNLPFSAQKRQSRGNLDSPFIPIRSLQNSINISRREENMSLRSSSKRRSSHTPGAEERGAPPRKRYSNEVSPWKRGLGYFDSSDSDDAEDEVRGRRRAKHSRSPKRVKASQSLTTPGSKRNSSDKVDTLVGDDSSSVLSPKRRRVIDKHTLQSYISNSVKRSHSGEDFEREGRMKILRSQNIVGHTQGDCEEGFFGDRSNLSQGNSIFSTSERNRPRNGAFQTLVDAGDAGSFAKEEENYMPHTSKMGRNCVKNSLGKLLPVRGQSEYNLSQCVQDKSNEVATETELSENRNLSPLTNIADNLRGWKTVFESPNSQRKRKSDDLSSPSAANDNGLENSSRKTTHAVLQDEQQANFNPLANVVLTPPSADSSLSRSHTQQVATASPRSPGLEAKRKKPSAAERLKKFWTGGNTFKSLFLTKSKSTPGKSATESSVSNLTISSPSFSSPSNVHQSDKSLLCDSNHMHFSSSPASSSSFQLHLSRSSPRHAEEPHGSTSSPALNIGSVSPIFASLPSASPSDSQIDKGNQRFSSILQMSAKAQKRGSESQNSSPARMPTRTSPRLQHSSPSSGLASPPVNVPSRWAEIQILPQLSQFHVLRFRLADTLEVSVRMGDLAEEASSGIVNWTDESLTHTVTECSQQIAARAGALMRAGCADYLNNKGDVMEAPDVLTTPAGGRFPKTVEALLHVVSPRLKRGEKLAHGMTARLLEVNANCLRFANERLGLQSLSLPLIGRDLFTSEVAIKAFFDSVIIFLTESKIKSSDHLSPSPHSFDLTTVRLVISDATTTDLAAELINASLNRLAQEGIETVAKETFMLYYGDNSPKRNQTESIDRASSGRPRVKRPKL